MNNSPKDPQAILRTTYPKNRNARIHESEDDEKDSAAEGGDENKSGACSITRRVEIVLKRLRGRILDLTDQAGSLPASSQFRVQFDQPGFTIEHSAIIACVDLDEWRQLVEDGRVHSIRAGEKGAKRIVPLFAIEDWLRGR